MLVEGRRAGSPMVVVVNLCSCSNAWKLLSESDLTNAIEHLTAVSAGVTGMSMKIAPLAMLAHPPPHVA